MSQLPSVAQQTVEITQQSLNLSAKLTDLALNNTEKLTTAADPLVFSITILVLASFVGYYIIWKVTPALHTPLMSITNAISGIIILSSMIAADGNSFLASLLGYLATFLASINIFGGFIVTERMLEMFRKKVSLKYK